jgi:hypothetical protein
MATKVDQLNENDNSLPHEDFISTQCKDPVPSVSCRLLCERIHSPRSYPNLLLRIHLLWRQTPYSRFGHCQPYRNIAIIGLLFPEIFGRIILVEDLSADVTELLGSCLDIDPLRISSFLYQVRGHRQEASRLQLTFKSKRPELLQYSLHLCPRIWWWRPWGKIFVWFKRT